MMLRPWLVSCAVWLVSSSLAAQTDLLVSGFNGSVGRYAVPGGALLDTFDPSTPSLAGGHGLACGPDGNIYVASFNNNRIMRFAPDGTFIDVFVPPSGGAVRPAGVGFGPDRNLYVASMGTNEVLRFDGTTGAFIDAFVSAGSGGLNGAEGFAWGPDGNLYVASETGDNVLRYDGQTGAFIDVFASGSGLNGPHDVDFDASGNLYVPSFGNNRVLKFDSDGVFVSTFVGPGNGLQGAHAAAIGPEGDLYVAALNGGRVNRYNGVTGAFIEEFAGAGGGVNSHANLLFTPTIDLPFYGPLPGQTGVVNTFEVTKAAPNSLIYFLAGTVNGTVNVPMCGGTRKINIADPIIWATLPTDAQGDVSVGGVVPPVVSGVTLYFQAVDLASCRVSKVTKFVFP